MPAWGQPASERIWRPSRGCRHGFRDDRRFETRARRRIRHPFLHEKRTFANGYDAVERPNIPVPWPAFRLKGCRGRERRQVGVRPALACTYVDVGKTGSCYAAAGRCEKTTVRAAKPLCAGEALRGPTRREPAPPEIADWTEYGRPSGRTAVHPGGGRKVRESRFVRPQRAERKAAYRFLSNERVTRTTSLAGKR